MANDQNQTTSSSSSSPSSPTHNANSSNIVRDRDRDRNQIPIVEFGQIVSVINNNNNNNNSNNNGRDDERTQIDHNNEMKLKKKIKDKYLWRDLAAYWILGLCNNYGYVVMLSAAHDIIERFGSQQEDEQQPPGDDDPIIDLTIRKCNIISTGAILLADILPSLIVKVLSPFLPFFINIRILSACLLQIGGFLLVAFAETEWIAILGVIFTSLSSGLGETSFLAYSSFFNKNVISTWSSGTGGAGIIGSLSYAGLIQLGVSSVNTMLIMLIVPLLEAISFWLILRRPQKSDQAVNTDDDDDEGDREGDVNRNGDEGTEIDRNLSKISTIQIIDNRNQQKTLSKRNYPHNNDDDVDDVDVDVVDYEAGHRNSSIESKSGRPKISEPDDNEQKPLIGFKAKFMYIPSLFKYMIPLTLVYLFEYFINQGLFELVYFPNIWLSQQEQYRWLQVDYQIGVFISRSSVNLFAIDKLWMLAVLQFLNVVFFMFEIIYFFSPSIWLIFAVVFWEGLLGGGAYVNTFYKMSKEIPSGRKKFALGVVTLSDSVGIALAGVAAIPSHNALCGLPQPIR